MANQEYMSKIESYIVSDTVKETYRTKAKEKGIEDADALVQSVAHIITNIQDKSKLTETNFNFLKETVLPLLVYSYFSAIRIDVTKYNAENTILFKECSFEITGILGKIFNTNVLFDNTVTLNLLSNVNKNIDFENYTNELFDKDIDYLYSLLFVEHETAEDFNQQVLEDIKYTESDDKSFLQVISGWKTKKEDLYKILKSLYQNTFSLYPYEGVLFFRGEQTDTVERVNRKGEKVQKEVTHSLYSLTRPKDRLADEGVKPILVPKSRASINAYKAFCLAIQSLGDEFKKENIVYERCFDIDKILREKHSLYYPYEAFGFSIGAEFSKYYKPKENDITYEPAPVSKWEDYFALIKPALDELFVKYIYKALEHFCKKDGESFKFTDDAFLDDYYMAEQEDDVVTAKANLYEQYCNEAEFRDTLNVAILRLCRTLCKAVVLTRNDADDLYKIRVCSEDFSAFNEDTTPRRLFNNTVLTKNNADIVFDKGLTVDRSNNLGVVVMEYQFCLDPEIVNAKPLFGYMAAQLFQQNHTIIDKKHLLLGEDPTGTPIFSESDGVIDTSLKMLHRFSAGSRSGKGVITMNILASLVASDTSVFYIDRKPDMASELCYITNGDMYCVNGGDLQLGEDSRNQFKINSQEYGPMLKKYQPGSPKYKPSYMTGAFSNSFGDTWTGDFGDFIYERAALFALSILVARCTFIAQNYLGQPDSLVYKELDLGNNMSIVIDEITNWHHRFEYEHFYSQAKDNIWHKYYHPSLGLSAIEEDEKQAILDSLESDKAQQLQNALTRRENCLASTDEKEREKLSKIDKEIENLLKDSSKKQGISKAQMDGYLYWSTFSDKMQSIIKDLGGYQNAGWKPEMGQLHDIFLIGQIISGSVRTGQPILFNKSNGKEGTERPINAQPQNNPELMYKPVPGEDFDDRGACFFVTLAENMGNDWFTGRLLKNPDDPTGPKRPNFGATAMAQSNPELYKWLHLDGNWMYIKDGKQDKFHSGDSDAIPTDYIKIKPYLVLNNSEDPDKEGLSEEEKAKPKYKYVKGCKGRINRIKPGTWEKIKPDFIDESTKELHKGMGLKGLVKEYKRTQNSTWDWGKGFPNPFANSKRIADAVARRLNPKYHDYMDLLLDLSPEGLFDGQDIVRVYEAAMNNQTVSELNRLEKQLPRYFNTGNIDAIMGHTQAAETVKPDEGNAHLDITTDRMEQNAGGTSLVSDSSATPIMTPTNTVENNTVLEEQTESKNSWNPDDYAENATESGILTDVDVVLDNPEVAHIQAEVKKDMSILDKSLFSMDNLELFARMTLETYKQALGIDSLDAETEQNAINYLISVYVENLKLNK